MTLDLCNIICYNNCKYTFRFKYPTKVHFYIRVQFLIKIKLRKKLVVFDKYSKYFL